MKYSEIDLLILKSIGGVTTQKTIAQEIGYSVGKVNFALKSLAQKGLVKAEKFVNWSGYTNSYTECLEFWVKITRMKEAKNPWKIKHIHKSFETQQFN